MAFIDRIDWHSTEQINGITPLRGEILFDYITGELVVGTGKIKGGVRIGGLTGKTAADIPIDNAGVPYGSNVKIALDQLAMLYVQIAEDTNLDIYKFYEVDTSAGAVTVTLPTITTENNGAMVSISKDGVDNYVSIASANTVGGEIPPVSILEDKERVMFKANNATGNWDIVASNRAIDIKISGNLSVGNQVQELANRMNWSIIDVSSDVTAPLCYKLYYVDTTAGDVTITLDDVVDASDACEYKFSKSAGDNAVRIITAGGQLIGGETEQIITTIDKLLTIKAHGLDSHYNIVQDSRPDAGDVSLTFYGTTSVSTDPAGFFEDVTAQDDTRYDTVEVEAPLVVTGTDQLLASYIADPGAIQGTISAQTINIIGQIKRTSPSGSAYLYEEIYHRTAAGVETLIGTSSLSPLLDSATYQELNVTAVINEIEFTDTDRWVEKLYGNVNSGSPEYVIKVGGELPARTVLSAPSSAVPHNSQSGIQGGGPNEHYHLTESQHADILEGGAGGAGDKVRMGMYVLGANQISDLDAGDVIKLSDEAYASSNKKYTFDNVNYRWTLKAGLEYRLDYQVFGSVTGDGNVSAKIYSITDTAYLDGVKSYNVSGVSTSVNSSSMQGVTIITPSVDTIVELRILAEVNLNNLFRSDYLTNLTITEIEIGDGAITTISENWSFDEVLTDSDEEHTDGLHYPVYRKAIDFGACPSNGEGTAPHGITNFKQMIDIRGYMDGYSDWGVPLPFISTSGTPYYLQLFNKATTINVRSATDVYANAGATIVVYCTYIKTGEGQATPRNTNATALFQNTAFPSTTSSEDGEMELGNGVIIKWGSDGTAATTDAVTFATAFPNNCWNVQVTLKAGAAGYSSVDGISSTGFTAYKSNGFGFRWVAIGN